MNEVRIRDVSLLVLGSGTSAGVPIIGCDCDVCTSSDPRDRRTRPSSCLRFRDAGDRERLLLIDTAPDLREQSLRHGLRRCDAILFTHSHFDHTFGLDDVRRFNALMRDAIPVYAEAATMDFLETVYGHIFHKDRNVNASFVATLLPERIAPADVLELHGVRVTALRLLHGSLPILGFRFDPIDASSDLGPLPLAYLTDVSAIPDETWPALSGLRTLVLDLLRYTPHPTHLSADEAIAHAERIGAERTLFVHMTHDVRHADLDAKLPEGMSLAYDGLVLDGRR